MGGFSGAANARPSVDDSTIEYNGNQLRLKASGVPMPVLPVFIRNAAALGASTVYVCPGADVYGTTESDHQVAVPACAVAGFSINVNVTMTAARTLTVRLRKNGADVGTALTFVSASSPGSASVTFTPVSFAASDLLSWSLTGDGAGTITAGTDFGIVALAVNA